VELKLSGSDAAVDRRICLNRTRVELKRSLVSICCRLNGSFESNQSGIETFIGEYLLQAEWFV